MGISKINDFEKRKKTILNRIQKHYSQKLNRKISKDEAEEIANNLLNFAKAIASDKTK